MMSRVSAGLMASLLLAGGAWHAAYGSDEAVPAAVRLFQQRILPIVRSGKASSCTECHFAGVDLSLYVKDDPYETFAALRQQGLVDPEHPEQSKLLQFIARKPQREDPLMARVRKAEYEAFLAWIKAAAADTRFRRARPPKPLRVGIELDPAVVRHARTDRVVARMLDTIWPEFGRCVSCHAPGHNQRLVRKYGERMNWIVPHHPEATLRRIVAQGLVDSEEPERSLLLLKPLAKEVKHGGGPKFVAGSRTDRVFRQFLRDFAYILSGRYRRPEQLPSEPQEVVRLTDQHLRLVELPRAWQGKLLRVDVYALDGDTRNSMQGIATAENPVAPRRPLWQSVLLATARRGTTRAKRLAHRERVHLVAERFLLRVYVDLHDRTKHNRDYVLGEADHVADIVVNGPWPAGYRPPKIVSFRRAELTKARP